MGSSGNDLIRNIFSTKGLLVIIGLLIVYWVFFKGDSKEEQAVYQPPKSVVGVSNVLNQEAIEKLGVDLTEHLDPKLIPALVEQSMKEAVDSGAKENEFIQVLVSKASNKIQEMSTIDLNNDGFSDPVLVIPQNVTEGQEHMLLSIRVPDPAEVSILPAGSDQEAWADIAQNKSIEVMTTAAIKESDQNMVIQSSPNPQMYASHPPYYHHYPSFTSILMTSMMLNMLAPRFMGPGMFGGYGYAPTQTTVIRQNRDGTSSNLKQANGSNTAAKSANGQSIASNNFKKVPPKSMNQIKTSQFKARNSQRAAGAGGFGKSQAAAATQKPAASPSRKSFSNQRKSSGSFGSSRRSFGGFGKSRR